MRTQDGSNSARHWLVGNVPGKVLRTGFRNENVYVFPNLGLVITRHAMPQPTFFGWSQTDFLNGMLGCFGNGAGDAAANRTAA